jgi:16S rRNA (uracil1498-N3)-methyltransferase
VASPVAAAAHVFVADLETLQLDEADSHHLARSLRLRPGEAVTASDGAGGWRLCRFAPGPALEPDGPVRHEPRPRPEVTVGFALAKGERPEWATQKLTEVGVDHIVPLLTSRSVVRWDGERAARNHARLIRVAREAAMQSRRTWLPQVGVPVTFAQAAEDVGRRSPVALAHPGGRPPSLDRPALLVGPEGGWGAEELASGLPTVGLGQGVLRVETAAVAAGVLLCALRAGLVTPGANDA